MTALARHASALRTELGSERSLDCLSALAPGLAAALIAAPASHSEDARPPGLRLRAGVWRPCQLCRWASPWSGALGGIRIAASCAGAAGPGGRRVSVRPRKALRAEVAMDSGDSRLRLGLRPRATPRLGAVSSRPERH